MKLNPFSSFKAVPGRVVSTALSMAVSMAVAAACAAPVDAFAHKAHHHAAPVAAPAKAGKAQAVKAMHAAYSPRGHHRGGMRKVAFQPHRALAGEAFSMHNSGHHTMSLVSSVGYMVDQETGETLYDKNSTSVVPIASISKLMTAMVVLDSKASMTEPLTVTDEDRDYIKNTGSRLTVGSVLSRRDMLHIALMASENRAAAALSRYYPGGRPAFLAAMNEKAKEIGMTNAHFESPTGLTSANVATARDLVKMVDAAYQYPLIREFSTDRSYTVHPGAKHAIAYNSTNALVRSNSWDIGLQKTGFINEAGECLVMQANIGNRPVVMVLLDSYGKYSRFADAIRMRNWLASGGAEHNIQSADAGGPGT